MLKSDKELWYHNLHAVNQYIERYKKLPSSECEDIITTRLGRWILTQKTNYKNNKYSMNDDDIKKSWETFIETYATLFRDNCTKWNHYLQELEQYILTYNKLPVEEADGTNKQLAKWCSEQRFRYKKQMCIMKQEEVRNQWETFTQKYVKYFMSNEEIWKDKLIQVEDYALENGGKLPYMTDKNPEIKVLAKWLYRQSENYKDNKQGMLNPELRNIWEDFIKRHPCRKFMTPEEYWLQTFNKLVEYVDIQKQLPSDYKDTRALATWMKRQRDNYKIKKEIMGNDSVRKHWEIFTKNYAHLF
jgi:hypothetical protein